MRESVSPCLKNGKIKAGERHFSQIGDKTLSDATLPSKILIIDNDPSLAKQIANALERYKINAVCASNWEEAIYHFNTARFDCT